MKVIYFLFLKIFNSTNHTCALPQISHSPSRIIAIMLMMMSVWSCIIVVLIILMERDSLSSTFQVSLNIFKRSEMKSSAEIRTPRILSVSILHRHGARGPGGNELILDVMIKSLLRRTIAWQFYQLNMSMILAKLMNVGKISYNRPQSTMTSIIINYLSPFYHNSNFIPSASFLQHTLNFTSMIYLTKPLKLPPSATWLTFALSGTKAITRN